MTYDPRLEPYISPAVVSHAKFFPRGPFISIILSQGIVESAWFTRVSGKNNYFGIKANAAQIAAGTYTTRTTHEVINGETITIDAKFADYPDIAGCFDAHAHLLTSPHYDRCVHARTPQDYAQALLDCGYATAPNYATVLIDYMDRYQLYQFDTLGIDAKPSAITPAPAVTKESWLAWIEHHLGITTTGA